MVGALLAAGATAGRRLRRRPYNVLRLELSGEPPENEAGWWASDLGLRQKSADFLTLLATLRAAREDCDLGLVMVDVHGLQAGWSRIQSLRRGLHSLRRAGKRVWVYLSSNPGMRDYYLATAADRVLLTPGALFDATGIASEVVFLKGTLDKLGVEAQMVQAGRFKSAAEPFTRTTMSDEHRAMVDGLLDDLYAQLVSDIAAARGLTEDGVRAALRDGPLLAREALARGLVDALAYPDQVEEALDERFGEAAPIDLARYRRRRALEVRRAALGAPQVGYLAVSGTIGLTDSIPAAAGSPSASWRVFRRELAAMARDPRLAAIVIRVDSPGGSGLASDLMWREVTQSRRHKPILVSMGDLAASGGYYLAVGADHVTAEPATITGSIGVLAGKPVLRGLYDRLGVSKEIVVRGNAARHSDYVPLDAADLARLQAEAQEFYGDFVARVAAGRGLELAAVENVAEGRVWTGRQAIERGLVDRLGGIEQVLDEARRRLELAPDAPLALDRRPRARNFWRLPLGRRPLAGDLASQLQVVAPLLVGERLLAAMPFLVRFVSPGDHSGTRALAASAMAGVSRFARYGSRAWSERALDLGLQMIARVGSVFRRPPLVF